MRSQDVLSGLIIMAKAAEFALHLKHHDFAASEGWFHCFRQRHDLIFCTAAGEGKDVSVETSVMWQNEALKGHLDSYMLRDILTQMRPLYFSSSCVTPTRYANALRLQ
ncbi:hypothetical protein ISCGN_009085 [Ixodes scapularis]